MTKRLKELEVALEDKTLSEEDLFKYLDMSIEAFDDYKNIVNTGLTHLSHCSDLASRYDTEKGFLSLEDLDLSRELTIAVEEYINSVVSNEDFADLSVEYFLGRATKRGMEAVGGGLKVTGSVIAALGTIAGMIVNVIVFLVRIVYKLLDFVARIIRSILSIIFGLIGGIFNLLRGEVKVNLGLVEIWRPWMDTRVNNYRYDKRMVKGWISNGLSISKRIKYKFNRSAEDIEGSSEGMMHIPEKYFDMIEYAWPIVTKVDGIGSLPSALAKHIRDMARFVDTRGKEIVKITNMMHIDVNLSYSTLDNASRLINTNLATLNGQLVKMLNLSDANLFTRIIAGPSSVKPETSLVRHVGFGRRGAQENIPKGSTPVYHIGYKNSADELATHIYVINEVTFVNTCERLAESRLPNEGMLKAGMEALKDVEREVNITLNSFVNNLKRCEKEANKAKDVLTGWDIKDKNTELKVNPKDVSESTRVLVNYVTSEAIVPKILTNELTKALRSTKIAMELIKSAIEAANTGIAIRNEGE